jgi:uncharacterized protein (TIGR02145 family)
MKNHLTFLFLFAISAYGYSQPGSITEIQVLQRPDGSGLVDVTFDLSGDGDTYSISVEASFDGGGTFQAVSGDYLWGDLAAVAPGGGLHIVWDVLGSFPETYTTDARLRLTASAGDTDFVCGGVFTDPRDQQIYNTVLIGDQCWMAENLKYLPAVHPPGEGSEEDPHYYVYGYSGTDVDAAQATANFQNYGVLYNWPAVMAGASSSSSNPSGVQGICPTGWHVPSDAEWTELVNYVVDQGYPNSWGDPNGAGNALKSCMQVDSPLGGDCDTSEHPRWNSHSTHYGFDEFGFSALPGGYRSPYGSFYYLGTLGFWWSSTERSSTLAWSRRMYHDYGDVNRSDDSKTYGFSLRCVRD